MYPKITWLVEKQVWDEAEEKRLLEALAKTDSDVILYSLGEDVRALKDKVSRKADGPIIGRGSIQFIKNADTGIPWAYVSWPEFRCSNYFIPFIDELIHGDFAFLPWGLLPNMKNSIYNKFKNDQGEIFIRPDTNDKVFSGKVVPFPEFDKWWKQEEDCYSPPKSLQCVISRPMGIMEERRYICSVDDCSILSFSSYKKADCWAGEAGCWSGEAGENRVIHDVLEKLKNDPMILGDMPFIVVDMAWTKYGWFLVEFGSINCCSWYDCDPLPIINAINERERRMWNVE